DPQGHLENELKYSERMHHIFRRMVSNEFLAIIPETSFGSPLVFEHDGLARSVNFRMNAATTRRIVDLLERFGKGTALRILEIGSGWGACPFQLHHVIQVDSYTVIDLPENLYLCGFHLGTVLPYRRLQFIDLDGPPIREIPSQTICAALPGAIDRIEAKYDL